MTYRRLLVGLAISFAIPATACDWLDESCPEGYWRMRAGEACVPLPVVDAGTDAGTPPVDGGPPDAASADAGTDAATPSDAATDAATPSDGSIPPDGATDAAATDAAADAATDAS